MSHSDLPASLAAWAYSLTLMYDFVRSRSRSFRWGVSVEFRDEFLDGCRCHDSTCVFARPLGFSRSAGKRPNATAALLCAFREAVKHTARMLDRVHKGVCVWRTIASSQYFHGTWNSNGDCNLDKPIRRPYKTQLSGEFNTIIRQEIEPYLAKSRQHKLRQPAHLLLDVEELSDLRPDAKPSDRTQPGSDCTHWCLPGIPDLWNLLMLNQLCNEKCAEGVAARWLLKQTKA